jgi:glycosyltransferase involved in cell wall biosynthesis
MSSDPLRPSLPLPRPLPAAAPLCGKILVAVTEDWFALSHFKPLIRALVRLSGEVVVATNPSGRMDELAALGTRPVAFDYRRSSRNPFGQPRIVAGLRRLIAAERPDAVHTISLKPMILGGLAHALAADPARRRRLVLHLTGVGYAGTAPSLPTRAIHGTSLAVASRLLRRPDTVLFAENPDDAAGLIRGPADPNRVTVLGGAGIDPAVFRPTPPPDVFRVGFVGRIVWTKGVDVLVAAHRILRDRGVMVGLELCGWPDAGNHGAVSAGELAAWVREPGITHRGRVSDIAGFWAGMSVAVVPSRGGEGMPRAMLEAAGSGRPLIVTDVPGCRHFVRNGVEGVVVPASDAAALADAIERLYRDPELARRFGAASRARVLDGFTEAQVEADVAVGYRRLLRPPGEDRGRDGSSPPLPPNRTGGFPAYGSPVGGFFIETVSRSARLCRVRTARLWRRRHWASAD